MDAKQIEAVLAEVGKVFRLCRFYPATHPTVQQAMADLSAVLPSLAAMGDVELRIGPTGLALETVLVTGKNPQMQEFAGLLYSQGYRAVLLSPGATAEEFAALVRATAGAAAKRGSSLGVVQQKPQLPHIQLEQAASRKSTAARPARSSAPAMHAVDDGPALSSRGTGVFRPNALPVEIEVSRLASLLEFATPEGARGPLTRLAEVMAQIAEQRDFAALAAAVKAAARWQTSEDPAAADAARRALAAGVSDGSLAGMVGLVADDQVPEEQRGMAVEALGALGARATPALFEAYLAAADDAVRDSYGRALVSSASAREYLVSRLTSEHVEAVRAAAALLGGLGDAGAVAAVAPLTRHPDPALRRAAIGALARIGGAEASRAVVAAIKDADAGVRLEAAVGVARLADRAFGPIVQARLEAEPDDGVVVALADTLGSLREARAVPQLAELAKGVSGVFRRFPLAVRVAAVRALVTIGTPEALAAVEPFKADRNPELKAAASGAPR
ncbi:MAG TPA: HEAT repeat domain-containing protein [Gemmatimonadales bacterium]|nr:HEAT repeat domain-containing protein [Gemmatimonadales bacterium]